jgi:hypothetical protein
MIAFGWSFNDFYNAKDKTKQQQQQQKYQNQPTTNYECKNSKARAKTSLLLSLFIAGFSLGKERRLHSQCATPNRAVKR